MFGYFIDLNIRIGFLSNLFSDIIIGIIFSIIIAFWVNKFINEYQRSQLLVEERKRVIGNTIQYLKLIQLELDKVSRNIPDNFHSYAITETPIPPDVNVSTPLWNLLQPSGELPKEMDPKILSELANCHSLLSEGRKWVEIFQRTINSFDISKKQVDIMADQITGRFQEVKQVATEVIPKIKAEITRLSTLYLKLK
jgi:hypothetical protein